MPLKKSGLQSYKKKYDCEPPQLTEQKTESSVDAEMVMQKNDNLFYLDPTPMFW